MGYFATEDAFNLDVDRLNVLLIDDCSRWQYTEARKNHEDLFGLEIKAGEIYFKRQYGAAWDADVKLSRLSMERMLFAVLAGNSRLEYFSDGLIQKQQESLRQALTERKRK